MYSLIKALFGKKPSYLSETDLMKKFLVVGLGNIGAEYENTRHNIGFQVLDHLAQKQDFTFTSGKLGSLGSFKVKGRSVLLLKPSTFMNRSGKAVKYWMEKEKIPFDNVLIITDDLNLPFGTLRLKTKGSDGGHNGLADIQTVLQTVQYNRLRFGLGDNYSKGRQVDYVLGIWDDEEVKALPERLEKCVDMVLSFVLQGVQITMNQYNNT